MKTNILIFQMLLHVKFQIYTHTRTNARTHAFWEHLLKAILETCDIWDTAYNSDNWEPEFMTIFVTWQLIVTLDSIRNYCDVLFLHTTLQPDIMKYFGYTTSYLLWVNVVNLR